MRWIDSIYFAVYQLMHHQFQFCSIDVAVLRLFDFGVKLVKNGDKNL
ncbi:Uncharacterised protein [Providencia rettgeri]|uniref:Uncharacterized protein n=1 Tax=Providencia rettgeri TaxID=587 RepID=A0A9N8GWD6_PRORE|nr:Uncharacterised protein [Providencia rettgeri]CAC9233049.1 Uncharacterised protein [Providencia rettgeri]